MQRSTPRLLAALAVCALAAACTEQTATTPDAPAALSVGNPLNTGSQNAFTLAVIGDTPYGPVKRVDFPFLVDLINGDPKVDLVAHLGDIKAGSNAPCTNEYFADIRGLFDDFKDPLVYTPGDNEWTDCHQASKNNGLYTPTERLEKVREVFFPVAGQSLGGRKQQLITQADDEANSAYVENVMWMQSRVLFVTANITGSNNDLVSWGTPLPSDAGNYPSQAAERTARAEANRVWLAQAFETAAANGAVGVVVMSQADMWDPTQASLTGFDALAVQIGNLAAGFEKPVLLLEGDSHKFLVDNPYSASSPFHGFHPSTPVADNVTRIVVEGSDAGRTEYLRLTVDPQGKNTPLFSWERVPLHP